MDNPGGHVSADLYNLNIFRWSPKSHLCSLFSSLPSNVDNSVVVFSIISYIHKEKQHKIHGGHVSQLIKII